MVSTVCDKCGDSFEAVRSTARFCSTSCRVLHYRKQVQFTKPKPVPTECSYTAENIKIKSPEDFDFHLIDKWARKYQKPVEWVRRSVESCRLADAPLDYFKRRYLDADKTVPLNQEVDAISQALQDQTYRR